MTGGEEEKKSFQVVDRRRFDAQGNDRDGQSTAATPQSTSSDQTAAKATNAIAGEFRMESPTQQESTVNFTSFVMSLATQAMVQLGQMQPPPGFDIPMDREAAKGTIDILSMLQQKTAGNLSKEEGQFLEEVLHSLRVAYLRK
jgi:hypothetical protein